MLLSTAVLRVVVFIKIPPLVIRLVLLPSKAVLVVVESVAVELWELLVFVASVVAGGESKVLTVTAVMLLGEILAAKVAVFVFGAVAVLLAEKLVSVLGVFGVLSKAVGVKLNNGAPCTDDNV